MDRAGRGLSRRDLALAALSGAASLGTSGTRLASAADVPARVVAPGLEYVFEVAVQVGPARELGAADGITHRYVPILGGTVSGPRFNGRVPPGGNDTQRIHADGRTEILARYLLEASDGAIVQVTNPGVRRAAPEVMKRLLAGENIDPGQYYFRTTPTFETAASAYRWMLESVFVCVGIRRPDSVTLRYFAVL
jgi:hypothetical protein